MDSEKAFIEHHLNTNVWEPHERWDMYKYHIEQALPYECELILRGYHGEFNSDTRFSVNRLSNDSLTMSKNTGNAVIRDKRHVEDGYSDYLMFFMISGTGIVQRGKQVTKLKPGGIYIMDMAQTCTSDFSVNNKSIYIRIPRAYLESNIKGTGDTSLTVIDPTNGPGYLLRNYLLMLPRAIKTSSVEAAKTLFTPVFDLVNACLIERNIELLMVASEEADMQNGIDVHDQGAALYRRIIQTMQQHCMEPHFSIDILSERLCYSNSYLQRVFRKHETTFSKELQRLRIEYACNRLMQSSGKLPLMDVALASGFKGQSQFSRAFKVEVGISAREFAKEGCS